MNEDVLKPFPCKESACGASFFTLDHLTVHQQAKHNKLNLEIPKGGNIQIFSDQTPTPTRLLNNCEELRVFDDLQNINPFDETFRRAIDGSPISAAKPSNQDTLHTPQILPQFEPSPVKVENPVQDEAENLSLPSTNLTTDASDIPKEDILNDLKSRQKSLHQPISILPKPTPVITTQTPIIRLVGGMVTNDSKRNESVKDKLKNILLNNSSTLGDKKGIKTETVPTILIGTVPLVTTTNLIISNSSEKVEHISAQPGTTPKISNIVTRKRTREETSEVTILKVERNRAAAKRYRTKMKIQSQALQEKYEKSQREILSLKKELSELSHELAQVKAMLLLHKDCSLTKSDQINL